MLAIPALIRINDAGSSVGASCARDQADALYRINDAGSSVGASCARDTRINSHPQRADDSQLKAATTSVSVVRSTRRIC